MASNYDSVLAQLTDYGLKVQRIDIGRFVRCAVEGDREKRGWYIIHEVTGINGQPVFIGSYGIWQGSEQNAQKITFEKSELTDEQKSAFKKRLAEDKRRAESEQKRRAESASRRAESLWRKLATDGHADYLDKKAIAAFGVRFTNRNAITIPLLDASGRIHGLQFILDRKNHKDEIERNNGRDKQFWPPGLVKKGHFHIIGGTPSTVLLVAEGYATAATLHMATGLPVAIAFDAGNITPVVEALKKHYHKISLLICADDDRFARCTSCKEPIQINNYPEICPHCQDPHKRSNAGIKAAELTALQTNCRWIAPKFSDEPGCFDHYKRNQGKLTDFNDLHLQDGLHTVRTQIEDALGMAGWARSPSARVGLTQGGGENTLKPIDTVEELLERFSLVYGKQGTVFDHQEHLLMTLSDMRDACQSRELHRRWQESSSRRIVRAENVGFDPAGDDSNITCNLWAGWPTTAKAGKCTVLLELLEYMCAGESHCDLYNWVLRWLAYPIQNKGAKMRTTLVVHGPQGTGKNIFFEAVMKIYGPYGRIIDQSAIEDKFNDWASRKLFLIADEVVARSDLYHVKNKLKAFITGEWIRINPKNLSAYEERNHVNMVFLSNERMPVVLDEDDRRHAVIWTPEKLSPEFYKSVAHEIKNGGIEALHDYLLNLDLSGFDEHTKPPLNKAKQDLISLGKDNLLRFYDEWTHGEIDGFMKIMPVMTEDIYELYKAWCGRQGVKPSPLNRAIDQLSKRPGMRKERKRYVLSTVQSNPKYFLFPPLGEEMNPGNSESGWLGQCVDSFRTSLNDYRGNRYG